MIFISSYKRIRPIREKCDRHFSLLKISEFPVYAMWQEWYLLLSSKLRQVETDFGFLKAIHWHILQTVGSCKKITGQFISAAIPHELMASVFCMIVQIISCQLKLGMFFFSMGLLADTQLQLLDGVADRNIRQCSTPRLLLPYGQSWNFYILLSYENH